jgi:hypothetical protein
MKSDSIKMARIRALHEEMAAIHRANTLYWKLGEYQTRVARAEHERRRDQLDELRAELAKLRSS